MPIIPLSPINNKRIVSTHKNMYLSVLTQNKIPMWFIYYVYRNKIFFIVNHETMKPLNHETVNHENLYTITIVIEFFIPGNEKCITGQRKIYQIYIAP